MGIRARLYKAYAMKEGKEKALPFLLKLFGMDAEFKEEDHPRDEDGKFTSGGGGESVESITAQISKLSRFGSEGKKRKELTEKLKKMTEKQGEKPKNENKESNAPKPQQNKPENKGFPVTAHKEAQFDIIQKTNPMRDDTHVGIRKPSDIKSPEEAFNTEDSENFAYPDFTKEDGKKALETGKIIIYSSKPIENGAFVSPSKMMSGDYAGGGEIYSKEVSLEDVAWINSDEGQFASVKEKEPTYKSMGAGTLSNSLKMKEAENAPDNELVEGLSFEDLFSDLWNGTEEEEDPGAKEKAEREAKEQKEREAYGQNGLSESEYPEELRLTAKEREAVHDVLHGYRDERYKQKTGIDIMNALSGYPLSALEQREKQYKEELDEAEKMIVQRKSEGYSFQKRTEGMSQLERKKAWWDFYNENGYPPDAMIGESGIKHWQSQRKQAKGRLAEMETAKKIAKRNEFAKKSDHYMPWRKNPNSENNSYRPWEAHDANTVMEDSSREEVNRLSAEAIRVLCKLLGIEEDVAEDGGPGSGNWGHRGRPGKRGGSGKGGGKAMRSGSSATGYKSFAKSAEFEKLANLARKNYNKGSYNPNNNKEQFWRDVSSVPQLDKALREQHKTACPDESYSDYVDRMFDMLVNRVDNEKTIPDIEKIRQELSPEESLAWKAIHARNGITPQNVVNGHLQKDKREYLEILGNHAGWSERLLDRNFKHLTDQEQEDLNNLLDKHPWSDKAEQAGIPDEKALYKSESEDVLNYYNALKAKALGIGRVYVPERPASLDAKSPIEGWQDKLSEEDRGWVNRRLESYESLGEYVNGAASTSNLRKMLDLVAKDTDWNDKARERRFERLNDSEKKDMTYLLDQFPWLKGHPKYGNIPNEIDLTDETNMAVKKYFLALKAKELGVDGVTVPERPKEIEYAMTHKPVKEIISAQDSGYVHTPAGDGHRAKVKAQLSNAANNKFFSGMTSEMEEHRKAIIASVDQMDDRIAELVDKTMGNADIQWNDSSDTSCYNGSGTIALFTRNIDGSLRSPEDMVRTFWHEYGHFLDDEERSNAGFEYVTDPLQGIDYPNKGMTTTLAGDRREMYHAAAKKDLEALLESAGVSEKYGIRQFNNMGFGKVEIYRKSDGQVLRYGSEQDDIAADICELQAAVDKALRKALGYEKWENYLYDHGCPREPEYDDYMEAYTTPVRKITRTREKFKGAHEAYIQARKDYDQRRDEWVESIGGQERYYELVQQKSKLYEELEAKRSRIGGITDSLDEATNGMLGMVVLFGGHAESYYRRKLAPIETTANIFSARARNDADEIAFMNKVIPNISGLFTQAWRARYE